MSAGDLAAVLVALAAVVGLIVLLAAAQSMLRSSRQLRVELDRLHDEVLPLIGELRDTVASAGHEVARVDDLLDAAERIQRRVDDASRLTYVAFSRPLIKLIAFVRGVGRGVGRVFGRDGRRQRRVAARAAARAGDDRRAA